MLLQLSMARQHCVQENNEGDFLLETRPLFSLVFSMFKLNSAVRCKAGLSIDPFDSTSL